MVNKTRTYDFNEIYEMRDVVQRIESDYSGTWLKEECTGSGGILKFVEFFMDDDFFFPKPYIFEVDVDVHKKRMKVKIIGERYSDIENVFEWFEKRYIKFDEWEPRNTSRRSKDSPNIFKDFPE